MYAGALPRHAFAPRPPAGFEAPLDPAWAVAVARLFDHHSGELAAAFVEPIAQGAGGMWFYSPACLRFLREQCDRHGVLLVADEIATNFGRTGALFACEHAGVVPDVICVGKSLTGGVLTLAAAITSERVAAEVARSEPGALMHGPTFMANPLACAAALASLDLIEAGAWRDDVPRIEAALREALAPAADLPGVADVRVLGAIGVIEMEQDVDVPRVADVAAEAGVWLRPFGRLIYAMPPYVCTDGEIAVIGGARGAGAPGPGAWGGGVSLGGAGVFACRIAGDLHPHCPRPPMGVSVVGEPSGLVTSAGAKTATPLPRGTPRPLQRHASEDSVGCPGFRPPHLSLS
jgi:adenosylmethionine-8-amino-7-oxononanoate aminotransferase